MAIVASTFAAISSASANEDVTLGHYTGWAFEALSGGAR